MVGVDRIVSVLTAVHPPAGEHLALALSSVNLALRRVRGAVRRPAASRCTAPG